MGQPETSRDRASGLVPALLALVGGLLLVVGSLMSWVETVGPLASEAVHGVRSREGKIAFVCGLVLIAAAVVSWLSSSPAPARALFVVALVFGLVALGLTLYDVLSKDRQIDNAIRTLVEVRTGRILSDQQVARARDILARQGFSIEFQSGIWVALAGGLIGVVGAGWGAVSSSAGARTTPAPVPSGFGEPQSAWGATYPPSAPAATTEPPAQPATEPPPASVPDFADPAPPPTEPPPPEPPPRTE